VAPAELPVAHWPGPLPGAQPGPRPELLLYAVATPQTTDRGPARQLVRNALRQVLGDLLACPPTAVPLLEQAGQPLRLIGPAAGFGLSVSHEPGLSLFAIHRQGAIGIDLLQLSAAPSWQDEIPQLARDYLGPAAAAQLLDQPAGERASAFAATWTAHEAALKYLGEGLCEWSGALQRRLAGCRTQRLALPAGYVGCVALAA
jgi:4'-phosphopantetheinyl transferase